MLAAVSSISNNILPFSDCDEDLKCFQRDGAAPVPGCAGSGVDNYDYCYSVTQAPTSDGNLSPSSAPSGLSTANGTDSWINGTSFPSQAPSVSATLPSATDLELQDFGSEPAAEFLPLSRCQGDCDDDR